MRGKYSLNKSVLEKPERRNEFLDTDLDGRKILNRTLETQDTRIRTAFVWVNYGRMLGSYKWETVLAYSSKAGNVITDIKSVLTS